MLNRIKILREKEKLRQFELADKLHVSQGTLSNWEPGVHDPDRDSLLLEAVLIGGNIELARQIYANQAPSGEQSPTIVNGCCSSCPLAVGVILSMVGDVFAACQDTENENTIS